MQANSLFQFIFYALKSWHQYISAYFERNMCDYYVQARRETRDWTKATHGGVTEWSVAHNEGVSVGSIGDYINVEMIV